MDAKPIAVFWMAVALIGLGCAGGGGNVPADAAPNDIDVGIEAGTEIGDRPPDTSEGAPDAASPDATPQAPVCSTDGWCWSNPRPHGRSLNGIWTFAPNDAWAVGALGSILHWDGTAWLESASPTEQP